MARVDHKMKMGKREIPQSLCAQQGCKFYGTPAQQGVCFHRLEDHQTKYIQGVMKTSTNALNGWKELRKVNKMTSLKKWASFLEGQFVANWATRAFDLDNIVSLRAEIAMLELKIARLKNKK